MRIQRLCFTFLCLVVFTLSAHAQLPQDNAAWKARCTKLNSMSLQIDSGDAASAVVAGTHGVPSLKYATFARNRAKAGEHYVACTLYYMAAVAERANNGRPGNPKSAHNLVVVAQSELRIAQGRKPTLQQNVKRGEIDAKQVTAKALTAEDSAAILAAADTMPVA